jgi:hypothetical protein
MKRVIILVLLVGVAGVAGIVRSHSKSIESAQVPGTSQENQKTRDEIRKTVELSPGATVDVSGINGAVRIETSNSSTAEILIERKAESAEALARRKVVVETGSTFIKIRGEKGDAGFFEKIFGSSPSEKVTLKVPRQIALATRGVNGAVTVGEVEGSVQVEGINGKVEIGQAVGTASFKGINGNVAVSLKSIDKDGVSISGVNGNIELRFPEGLSADFEAHGMNGSVVSDLQDVRIEKERHGSWTARVGAGGNSISANGINGNIRFTRSLAASTDSVEAKTKS